MDIFFLILLCVILVACACAIIWKGELLKKFADRFPSAQVQSGKVTALQRYESIITGSDPLGDIVTPCFYPCWICEIIDVTLDNGKRFMMYRGTVKEPLKIGDLIKFRIYPRLFCDETWLGEAFDVEVIGHENPLSHAAVGILLDGKNIFIAQRAKNQSFPLHWEFPGGKIRNDENAGQALERRLEEELGVKLHKMTFFMDALCETADKTYLLSAFWVKPETTEIPPKQDHNDTRWIRISELDSYQFTPADALILEALKLQRFLYD